MKNKITPDQRYHEIPPIEKREKLLIQSAMYGTSIFKSELIDYVQFMYDFLDSKNILSQSFIQTQSVIFDCLAEPTEYGINHYLDPQSPSYQKGTLSEHLRASIEENASRMGINVQTLHYDPKLALAIHAAMMDYSRSLKKYYKL